MEIVYGIYHCYDVNRYGEPEYTKKLIGIFTTEEAAKTYCEKFSQPHIYRQTCFEDFWCGELKYEKVSFIGDINKSPWESGEEKWVSETEWLDEEEDE